jgi:lipid A oxidase
MAAPAVASADWLIAGYVGASRTPSTTLHVTPDAGTPFDLPDVEFRGESWDAPIYYGYRIGWLREHAPLGIEVEFTHLKTIGVETGSSSLTHFEQSHGLNFVLGSVTYRDRPRCHGRCVAVGRAGAGFTIPHVEATYLGNSVSSYQYGGPAVQAGAGLELAVHSGLTAIVDGRVTYTRVVADLPGATVWAAFRTWHFTIGAGWRFR